MRLPSHSVFPRELVRKNLFLKLNLYVYLPHNDSVIQYRKFGDLLDDKAYASLLKVPSNQVWYRNEDRKLIFEMLAGVLKDEVVKETDIVSPIVQSIVATTIRSLGTGAQLSSALEDAREIVRNLIIISKSASAKTYDDLIKIKAHPFADPLQTHQFHVSTLSVLLAISIGSFSMEDLADVAAAGLLHDLGLNRLPKSLIDHHLFQYEQYNYQEKIIYMRHVDLSVEEIKALYDEASPGLLKTVEHHHESWDGSGFKHHVAQKIYRPARVLRLADDIVAQIQSSNYKDSFLETFKKLTSVNGRYDPEIIAKIKSVYKDEIP